MLRDIAPVLRKIAYQQDLTYDEARAALNLIGEQDRIMDPQNSDGMFFLALTFGVMAKGPTVDELYGFVLSLQDNSVHFDFGIDPATVTDISGTGGGKVKTFNVGTAASFVVAASGSYVAKQASTAYTGLTGSADIFKELGLDAFSNTDELKVRESLHSVGLAAFYTPAFSPQFKNRIDFLTKLRTIGLTFPSLWHLVSWVYSPVTMNSRVYGVFDEKYIRPIAELFVRLGYRRGMVVYGADGLDEVSNIGPTSICEYDRGTIQSYVVTPEKLGVKRAKLEDIESHDREESMMSFFRVLYGKESGAKQDIVALNAGVSLYTMGRAQDLRDGVRLAQSLINSGASAKKVEAFAEFHGGTALLESWKKKSGV